MYIKSIAVTWRAKDRDNPTSPGLKASLPNTAKIAENRMTRSPMNSDHTPIHLQARDDYSDYYPTAFLLSPSRLT